MDLQMQKIVTNLWFDDAAEEAARFYTTLLGGEIMRIEQYTEAGAKVAGRPAGSVLSVAFTLAGQQFVAINGGPVFTFSPAVSLFVNCDGQDEVDWLWDGFMGNGGQESECGWLTDRWGLSWQIVPRQADELLHSGDKERDERVMAAMLQMRKIDLAALQRAFDAVG